MKRIERNRGAIAAIAGAGHGNGSRECQRASCRLAAIAEMERMEALMALPRASRVSPGRLGFRDDIQKVCSLVDDWSSDYAHVGVNVDAAHVYGVVPGFASGNKVFGPVR